MSYSKKCSMICPFGPLSSSIYQIFHCPLFTRDWKAWSLLQKNPLKSHISRLDIDTYVFDLPKSSWKGPCLFGDQYSSLMSLFSRTQLPKNLKVWFVDLGSPNRIQKGTLNSTTQPSCSYGAYHGHTEWGIPYWPWSPKTKWCDDPPRQRAVSHLTQGGL